MVKGACMAKKGQCCEEGYAWKKGHTWQTRL